MENILNRYLLNTAHAQAFTVLEQELSKLIIATVDKGLCIAIRKSMFDRLARCEPQLLNSKNIFTYEFQLSQTLLSPHPLTKYITGKTRSFLREGVYELEQFLCIYNSTNIPVYVFDLEKLTYITTCLKLDPKDPSNNQLIDDLKFKQKTEFFTDINSALLITLNDFNAYKEAIDYFIDANDLYMNRDSLIVEYLDAFTPSKTAVHTEQIGLLTLQEAYQDKIKSALYPLLLEHKDHDIAYLFGVFLDIANLDVDELAKFTTGYYTDIPYIKNNRMAVTALLDSSESSTDIRKELLIRGRNEVVHIIFSDLGNGIIVAYDKYLLADQETVNFRGEQIVLDYDCLIDDNLTVIEWLMVNKNTIIYKDIEYKREPLLKLALSGAIQNKFTNYLHDRSGEYHRFK